MQTTNNSINQVNSSKMHSIKSNTVVMKRVKRELEGARFSEEKKKIWEKTEAKEAKKRQMKKKTWQMERRKERSMPIFEEQLAVEVDSAQNLMDEIHDQTYGCECKYLHIYNNSIWADEYLTVCYQCEGRIYNYSLNKKEPISITEPITIKHPWGITTMIVDYKVRPVSSKALDEYETMNKLEDDPDYYERYDYLF